LHHRVQWQHDRHDPAANGDNRCGSQPDGSERSRSNHATTNARSGFATPGNDHSGT
jgi:hypothetical protein